jgi:hypothetical protein
VVWTREERNLLALQGIDLRFLSRPASSLVTIPTELWDGDVLMKKNKSSGI